jgi:hypothetical protein
LLLLRLGIGPVDDAFFLFGDDPPPVAGIGRPSGPRGNPIKLLFTSPRALASPSSHRVSKRFRNCVKPCSTWAVVTPPSVTPPPPPPSLVLVFAVLGLVVFVVIVVAAVKVGPTPLLFAFSFSTVEDLLGEEEVPLALPPLLLLLLLLPAIFDFEASSFSLLGDTARLLEFFDSEEEDVDVAGATTDPPPPCSFFFLSASSNFKSSISSKKLLSRPESSLFSASFCDKRSFIRIKRETSLSADAAAATGAVAAFAASADDAPDESLEEVEGRVGSDGDALPAVV